MFDGVQAPCRRNFLQPDFEIPQGRAIVFWIVVIGMPEAVEGEKPAGRAWKYKEDQRWLEEKREISNFPRTATSIPLSKKTPNPPGLDW